MALYVLSPGLLTTVQDLGRSGWARFGVPQSGAMDWFALQAANRLVGNPAGAAGLEFFLDPPVLQAQVDSWSLPPAAGTISTCRAGGSGCGGLPWRAGAR